MEVITVVEWTNVHRHLHHVYTLQFIWGRLDSAQWSDAFVGTVMQKCLFFSCRFNYTCILCFTDAPATPQPDCQHFNLFFILTRFPFRFITHFYSLFGSHLAATHATNPQDGQKNNHYSTKCKTKLQHGCPITCLTGCFIDHKFTDL